MSGGVITPVDTHPRPHLNTKVIIGTYSSSTLRLVLICNKQNIKIAANLHMAQI